jgi:diguanylate cyclase (GGDEF)-like protein
MALVLPDTDEKTALAIAEDFCRRLRDLRIPHSGSVKGTVTASVGVAALASGGPAIKATRLVSRADEALYAAKGAGRDGVKAWEPSRPRIVHSDTSRS